MGLTRGQNRGKQVRHEVELVTYSPAEHRGPRMLACGQAGTSSWAAWPFIACQLALEMGPQAAGLGLPLARVLGRLWWQREAAAPGLAQNSTLSAHVNRLPFPRRSQNAFHPASALQVLLSVFYGNRTKIQQGL